MQNSCDVIQKPRQMRKIGTTRRSLSGIYAFRGDTPIPFESSLERDFIIRKEFCVSVLEVIPQPVQIPFVGSNGQNYTYTPDFLVNYRLGYMCSSEYCKPILIEVKPRAEWKKHWREWLPKWKAAYRYAKEQGWEFHIHDESRIRDQALENIRFLDRYKRTDYPVEDSKAVIENLAFRGTSTFDYLVARHFMGIYKAEGIAHIWHLLATRQIDCDITVPLNNFTELWIPSYG